MNLELKHHRSDVFFSGHSFPFLVKLTPITWIMGDPSFLHSKAIVFPLLSVGNWWSDTLRYVSILVHIRFSLY